MPMGICDCRPPGPKGYFAVGILFFINLLNYADRFTLSGACVVADDDAIVKWHTNYSSSIDCTMSACAALHCESAL